MKAQDLMVGDYVTLSANTNARMQVVSIMPMIGMIDLADIDNHGAIEEYPFETLSGIPLTPDILEKNGFVKTYDNVYSIYQFRDESYSIMVQILSDNKYGVEIHNTISKKDDKGRNDLVTFARDWCSEIFIHELQNALRLCGIDKTIEI